MRRGIAWLATLVGLAGSSVAFVPPGPALAATGTVSVTAATAAAITISIADTTANFGTNLDPSGTNSNSADGVTDVQSAGGSYYIWKTGGVDITVSSSLPWTGTVSASPNTGTAASMTIASGALRWTDSGAPGRYTACSLATAFSTTDSTWKAVGLDGSTTYTTYYCLRDDWTDTPGTFASTVTYTAS